MKKATKIIFSLIGLIFGLVLTSTKIQASEIDVDVDFDTFYNGELVTHSQRTVKQGDTLIYEVEDFPDGVFMFWIINGAFRNDLQQNITITIYQRTFLEIHFGSELYYSAINQGLDYGESFGYDMGFREGVSTTYYDGFGGLINPDTNEPYDETVSFPYGSGYNKGFDDALTSTESGGLWGVLFSALMVPFQVLGIELLPGITIGMIVAVPLVFGLLAWILSAGKSKK